MDNDIEYSHISAEKIVTNGKCPPERKEQNQTIKSHFCKSWLVGIRLKSGEHLEDNSQQNLSAELTEYINYILSNELDAKIMAEYKEKVLKQCYQPIKLESKLMGTDELERW
ncbi:hypothetical protein niasHT_001000 [Heterodera trifolii]|uniref:Uncharacterized protein n=1 Tax=Heterodera trifolii TaxID=157864 RepID=A0ABD2LUK7_9BILA